MSEPTEDPRKAVGSNALLADAVVESLLPGCYKTRWEEKRPFGPHWCGPEKMEAWKETLVAVYEKEEGGDGQSVEVYCTAAPARFYRLHVRAEPNSIGEPQDGFEITTGSSQEELAAEIALAIAEGMLGFKSANTAIRKPHEVA